jgi:hypothetical protein
MNIKVVIYFQVQERHILPKCVANYKDSGLTLAAWLKKKLGLYTIFSGYICDPDVQEYLPKDEDMSSDDDSGDDGSSSDCEGKEDKKEHEDAKNAVIILSESCVTQVSMSEYGDASFEQVTHYLDVISVHYAMCAL